MDIKKNMNKVSDDLKWQSSQEVETQASIVLASILDVYLGPITFQENNDDIVTNQTHSKEIVQGFNQMKKDRVA